MEAVGRRLRSRRGLERGHEQLDNLCVVLLGASDERRHPGAADGAEADVGPVLASPVAERFLERHEVLRGDEVSEDLSQLAVASRALRVHLGEQRLGVLVRLGRSLDERVLRAPTLDVDAVSTCHGAPSHAPGAGALLLLHVEVGAGPRVRLPVSPAGTKR